MKNIKLVIGFSIFGFLLSLLSGLFSKSSFGVVIGHAFLFAFVFAVLAVVVQFVFQKFLEFDSDVSDFSSPQTAFQQTSSPKRSNHSVDLVVSDEDFPTEENEAKFYVSDQTKQVLFGNDAKKSVSSKPTAKRMSEENNITKNSAISSIELQDIEGAPKTEMPKTDAFVPVSLEKNATVMTTKTDEAGGGSFEAGSSTSGGQADEYSETDEVVKTSDGLDVLPDLEQIAAAPSSVASGVGYSSIGNAEEAAFVQRATKEAMNDAEKIAEGQDISVMAKAISTMLSTDK